MLEVGIVGAGIAGLAAAIALSRAGHDVEIFEKTRLTHDTGAGINISPNGCRVLSQWGFDFEKAGAVNCTRITRIRAKDLAVDSHDDFGHVPSTYGHRWCFFHRADLQAGLMALAKVIRPKVKIHLGQGITDIDVDTGSLYLGDGTVLQKDLIIVADGAHSTFTAKFVGHPYPVHRSLLSMYRFLLPSDQVFHNPGTEKYFEDGGQGFTSFYGAEVGRPGPMFTCYGIRSGRTVYCGVLHPSKPHERGLEGWSSPATVEDVMSVLGNFHPAVQAMAQKAKDVKVFTNVWRDPIETFTNGKAVLIGDAGHLMLPFHGQGSSMAFEDAMALQVLFTNIRTTTEVTQALQQYNKLRIPRVSAAQTMSNKTKPGLVQAMLDEVKTFYDGPIPGPDAVTFSKPYNDFFFAYDVAEEAQKLREPA